MQKPAFDILTICFSGEIDLLRLQARSLAAFFPSDLLGRIFVLVNDVEEEACLRAIEALRPDYGPHAARLQTLRPADLFTTRARGLDRLRQIALRLPGRRHEGGWKGHRGWIVQQALKLAAARAVTAPMVLILDAKNHFLKPVAAADLVAPDGRPRSRLQSHEGEERLRWIRASYTALGLTPPAEGTPLPPTVTPCLLPAEVFRRVLAAIEDRVGPVELFFLKRRSPATEFFLIHAATEAFIGPRTEVFADGLFASGTIFRSTPAEQVDRLLDRAEAGEEMMLGVHRARIRGLPTRQAARLEAVWHEAGILKPGERFRDLFPMPDPGPEAQDRFQAPDSLAGSPPATSQAILPAR